MIRALGLTALLATTVQAQESRPFRNSWFWGAKVGTLSVSTAETARTWAPSIGAEWLITRNQGGLWVFADHSSFDIRGSVDDPSLPSGRREVDIRNLRRFGFAAVVSPRAFGMIRPYAGLGMSLNVVGRAIAVADSAGNTGGNAVRTAIDDQRSRAAILGLAGAQAQFSRAALFTQITATPASRRFLLNEGPMVGWDVGVRYNFGSSVAR
ncbi:MAG TPA: hypothetical protein VMY38_00385 [Gemmatimonadaceae bacterium]|nr:hypothetical protein [Gemmatimonadaceae bacterium]